MRRILDFLFGTVEVELTTADPASAVTYYTENGIRLQEPTLIKPLVLRFILHPFQWRRLEKLAERRGEHCIQVKRNGLYVWLPGLRYRLTFWCIVASMLAFALYAPTRLWFLRVEGNVKVPRKEILTAAQECGLTFWTRTEDINSETFKNQILNKVPELQWAGVNLSGGVATICVTERLEGEEIRQTDTITNVVAGRDGIIVSMSVLGGESVCKIGQAVRAGELLVTGSVAHEYQPQYTHADAEIYALTLHQIEAEYPSQWQEKAYTGKVSRAYSILVGRKQIKIFGNSRISGTSCDKMTEVKYLTLPGGYTLPLALVVETGHCYESSQVQIPSGEAEQVLSDFGIHAVLDDMVAGQILNSSLDYEDQGDTYAVNAVYSCQEMISRQWKVKLFEGENTNDGTNRKRGTGGGSD